MYLRIQEVRDVKTAKALCLQQSQHASDWYFGTGGREGKETDSMASEREEDDRRLEAGYLLQRSDFHLQSLCWQEQYEQCCCLLWYALYSYHGNTCYT